MKIAIGIPARMGSSRFPGKPLCGILGLPMIEHVYKRCQFATRQDHVFIAACDTEIQQAVQGFGGTVLMTPKEIERPALRVAEACKQLNLQDDDIVAVVQGDEPLLHPKMLDMGIDALLSNSTYLLTNLGADLTEAEWLDPNEVKVVTNQENNAIYMSRSAIPSNTRNRMGPRMKQLGIYFFHLKDLWAFQQLPPTPLEIAESVEMLRAIEHGKKVQMVRSPFVTKSVDTEEDRHLVEQLMVKDPVWPRYAPQKTATSKR
jgi:3-deoxy-manno-octulosonate cytidylyltransferase (CMP-KDO synthetase)